MRFIVRDQLRVHKHNSISPTENTVLFLRYIRICQLLRDGPRYTPCNPNPNSSYSNSFWVDRHNSLLEKESHIKDRVS